MKSKREFYNRYHRKNSEFYSVIKDNNFTYFFHIRELKIVLSRMRKNSKVLDIGCGVGTLAFYLASKGFSVTGIDVSSRAVQIAKIYLDQSGLKNISFSEGDVLKIKTTTKYDLIICTEVIEHLENDDKMLESIFSLLNHKGILLLSTPSVNAPLFKMGLLNNFDREVGHLRRYKMEDLIQKLQKHGFQVMNKSKNESILRNSLFTIEHFGILIRPIKGPLVPLFHKLDDYLTSLFGESDLMVLAVKP